MANQLIQKLARAFASDTHDHGVHFHAGAGRAYVCEDPRCDRPALDPRDVAT